MAYSRSVYLRIFQEYPVRLVFDGGEISYFRIADIFEFLDYSQIFVAHGILDICAAYIYGQTKNTHFRLYVRDILCEAKISEKLSHGEEIFAFVIGI